MKNSPLFDASKQLPAILNKLTIEVDEVGITALLVHFKQVEQWGIPLGLTHVTGETLLLKHTVDSLLALPYLRQQGFKSVIDVGSGAGFPGLCLAAAMPSAQCYLVERKQKRLGFLMATKALMALNNTVVLDDIDKIEQKADAIVFRALRGLTPLIAKQLLGKASTLVAYKGRQAEAEKEVSSLQGFKTQIIPLDSKGFIKEERCLLVVKG